MLSYLIIITHGTQGTVLGHILFLIYINGLLNLIDDSTISFYADDTAILFHTRCIVIIIMICIQLKYSIALH